MNALQLYGPKPFEARIVLTSYFDTGVAGVSVMVKRREYEPSHFTNDVYLHENNTAKIWYRACGDKLLPSLVDKLKRAVQARNAE